MRFYRTAILASAIAIAWTPAQAGYHHVVYPVAKVVTPKAPGGGGNWHLCPTPAGIFICAVTVGIVVHELRGPACASRTKYNVAHGYDTPAGWWRPLCKRSRDPKPIAVRG